VARLIPDHYENNKRDAAGNPIGGAAGPGSSCSHKPNGCMVQVANRKYRLNDGGETTTARQGTITIARPDSRVIARERLRQQATDVPEMSDPLDGFSWRALYERYDAACRRFDSGSTLLASVVRVLSARVHDLGDLP
jgi:hypothetical protein